MEDWVSNILYFTILYYTVIYCNLLYYTMVIPLLMEDWSKVSSQQRASVTRVSASRHSSGLLHCRCLFTPAPEEISKDTAMAAELHSSLPADAFGPHASKGREGFRIRSNEGRFVQHFFDRSFLLKSTESAGSAASSNMGAAAV